MNRRKPVTVKIDGQDFHAALLTCGVSWKLSAEMRTIQTTMTKVVKGEPLSAEDEAAYSPAAIKVASTVLLPHHPECTEAWVSENVLDEELGVLIAKVWAASQPPMKAKEGGDPGAKSP